MKCLNKLFLTVLCTALFISCAENDSAIQDKQKAREMLTARTLGLAFLEENRLTEAEEQFQKLVEATPEEAIGYANLGIVYLRKGDYDTAERYVRQALDLEPGNVDVRLILAKALDLKGQSTQAIQELQKSLLIDPKHVKTHFSLSELYKNSAVENSASQREKHLAEVVRIAPAILAARIQLAELLLQNNKPDDALKHLEEIRRQMPELPSEAASFFEQAIILLQQDDHRNAGVPVRIFHNYLKATPLYQSGIIDLKGPGGTLVGFPILTFSQIIPSEIQKEKPILAALKFTDVSESSGLSELNKNIQHEVQRAGSTQCVAVADYDNDGDIDIYYSNHDDKAANVPSLMRNDSGKFVDISSEAGIQHTGLESSAIFADYDNDGHLDLHIAMKGPNRLFRNNGSGSFEDVSRASGIAGNENSNHAIFADFDQEGDLDLFVLNNGYDQLFRNNLDGTFIDRAENMGLSGPNSSTSDAAFADFDEDGDLDLFVVNPGIGNVLYSNLRQGQFKNVTEELGLLGEETADAVSIGDYNNDSFQDLFTTGSAGRHRLYLNIEGRRFVADTLNQSLLDSLQNLRGYDATFLDFDNDGLLDLFIAGESDSQSASGLVLLHNKGHGEFENVSSLLPPHIKQGRRLSVFDYNEDGDLDIVIASLDKGLTLLRNDGGNVNRYLKIRLVGLRTGNSKNNHFGVGAKLEVRTGDLYQTRVVSEQSVHFGLGQRLKADVVRIIWPNGVPQNLFYPGTDQGLVETQKLKGSCAFLYTWDGDSFTFVTDLMWRSALGMPVGIMAEEGSTVYAFADASREYLKIPGHLLQEKEGKLSLRITEELWETAYFDQLELISVDHPDSIDIFVDEKFVPPPFKGIELYPVSEKRLPAEAYNEKGQDVLADILEKDNIYHSKFKPTRFQGLTELHDLILVLDEMEPTSAALLFMQGWLFPTDASINVALGQSDAQKSVAPYLQVKDESGRWETVIENMGFPMGKDKTVVLDLTGKFLSEDRSVRIRTNMEIYWDHIFYSVDEPVSNFEHVELKLESADLRFRGFSREYRKGGRYGPHWFDYDEVSTEPQWRDLFGYYTRYGDVTSLLLEPDDMYVIMNSGDEVAVQFDADMLPELPPGWTRDFLIYTVGWIKDGDLNTAHGKTVAPLPFHAMSRYPYHEGEAYPIDEAHRQYLETYNTRKVSTESFKNQILHSN